MPEVSPAVTRRVAERALGLRRLATFFVVLGWIDLAFGILIGFVIASHDARSGSFNGSVDRGSHVGVGLALRPGIAISALFFFMIARALGVLAESAATRNADALG